MFGWCHMGYRYYDLHPEEIVYLFGHGLSYTESQYSDDEIKRLKSKIRVSFDLTNSGSVKGAEVCQLYIGDSISTVIRPLRELKYFDKIFLEAGETKKVTLSIEIKDMGYYNILLRD